MNNPWRARFGFWAWLFTAFFVAWPFHALGLGDTAALVIGAVGATVVAALFYARAERARIEEMRKAR